MGWDHGSWSLKGPSYYQSSWWSYAIMNIPFCGMNISLILMKCSIARGPHWTICSTMFPLVDDSLLPQASLSVHVNRECLVVEFVGRSWAAIDRPGCLNSGPQFQREEWSRYCGRRNPGEQTALFSLWNVWWIADGVWLLSLKSYLHIGQFCTLDLTTNTWLCETSQWRANRRGTFTEPKWKSIPIKFQIVQHRTSS